MKDLSDYTKIRKIFADISLDTFFNLNSIPSAKSYPHIDSFKHGFVSLNEKLFKEAKKKSQYNEESHSETLKLKRNHLGVLEDKENFSIGMKYKVGRSAIKYVNSHNIIRLFNGFFSLFEYHHSVYSVYPELFRQYFSTIFAVFSSLKKKRIEKMLGEICSNSRMQEFYENLYKIWKDEINNIEREEILQYITE